MVKRRFIFLILLMRVLFPFPLMSQEMSEGDRIEVKEAIKFLKANKIVKAHKIIKKLLPSFPENFALNYLMGKILYEAHNGAIAIPYLQKAIELNQKFVDPYNVLYKIYISCYLFKEAKDLIKMVQKQFGEKSGKSMNIQLTAFREAYRKISKKGEVRINGLLCNLKLKIIPGWMFFEDQSQKGDYKALLSEIISDKSCMIKEIDFKGILYSQRDVNPMGQAEIEQFMKLVFNSYRKGMSLSSKIKEKKGTLLGRDCYFLDFVHSVGFVKVYSSVIFISYEKGLLMISFATREGLKELKKLKKAWLQNLSLAESK